MSKKVNLSQINKVVELVDNQGYSFTDAGKAVGLCGKTARKYYWEYTDPEVEEKPTEIEPKRELVVIKQKPRVSTEDRERAEEKRRRLYTSLRRCLSQSTSSRPNRSTRGGQTQCVSAS